MSTKQINFEDFYFSNIKSDLNVFLSNNTKTILTLKPNPQKTLKNITILNNILLNEKYETYFVKTEFDAEMMIIQNASKENIENFCPVKKNKIVETYNDYVNNISAYVQYNDLTWIYNILDSKAETDRVLFSNTDFMLLPDIKWGITKKTLKEKKEIEIEIENLYCLAIVKRRDLRSIRDLVGSDIALLENILEHSYKTIEQCYGIEKSKLRAYFHYKPSFWHLHVHFNQISTDKYTSVEGTYSVFSVIQNLKIDPNYYQKTELEILI
jgi:m7GpppX diphosphatase